MTQQPCILALQDAFWCQVEDALLHHSNPWELDEALKDWGYQIGPCEAQDLVGLDQVLQRRGRLPAVILSRMVAEGRMGKKGGVGFYRYPGGGGAVIDPLIEDLIREEAWFGKIARHSIAADDLVDRLNSALAQSCRELADRGMIRGDVRDLLARAVHFPAGRELPDI